MENKMFIRTNEYEDTIRVMAERNNVTVQEYLDYIEHSHDLNHPACQKVLAKSIKEMNDHYRIHGHFPL